MYIAGNPLYKGIDKAKRDKSSCFLSKKRQIIIQKETNHHIKIRLFVHVFCFVLFCFYFYFMESQKYLTIVQPNEVTYARYDFNEREENILTFIIDALQKHMSREKELSQDLFNEFYVSVTDFETPADKRNYVNALDKMIKKTISFNWINPNNEKVKTTSALIQSFHVYENSKRIDITLNKWAMPYLLYWGNGGTIYNKVTALTLNGKYTKRLYKMCKRWEDRGGFKMDLDKFREMLQLPNSYSNNKVKERILDKAQKELERDSDVYFIYKMSKVNGSRSLNRINFKVLSNPKNRVSSSKVLPIEDKGKEYMVLYKIISMAYPATTDGTAMMVCDTLAKDNAVFKTAYNRFSQLLEELRNGIRTKQNTIPLIKHILDKDFGFKLMKKSKVKISDKDVELGF